MKVERYLSQRDAATLCRLAEQLLRLRDVNLNSAERLLDVISSAILLPEHATRTDCVSLHSEVTYRHVGAQDQSSLVLVCPHDANTALAHMSALAPLALALLGRCVGSIVQVVTGSERIEYVEILAVKHPSQPASHMPPRHSIDALPYLRDTWAKY